MKRLKILTGVFFLTLVLGCKSKPNMILKTDRHLVDSAYMSRIDSVKDLIDTICNNMKKNEYNRMLDSIIEVRIAEIQSLQNQ